MKRFLGIITNKFLLTIIAFGIWMMFFDTNDWFAQKERRQELANVNDNIKYLQGEISRLEKQHQDLKTDPQKLEQFAREEYHMKKDNEDVYLVK